MPTETTRRGRSGRSLFLAVAVLTAIWLWTWIPRLRGPIDLRWDASAYYVLGTALAEGKGYRLLNEPGEIEAVQSPPLLPILVAAHVRALGTADVLELGPRLRLLYFVLSGLYVLAAFAVVRDFLGPGLALLACAMVVLSFNAFLHPSDALYTEIPFALVSMLFLICSRRASKRGFAIAAGVFGIAAYLLRTAGIALLAAWVVDSVLARRFRQAVLRAVVAAIPVVLWQAHTWRVTSSDEYRNPAYGYQRSPYAYSNVTYLENISLVDSFRPERGRATPADLGRRALRNLAAVPSALGESLWMAAGTPEWIAEKVHRRLGLPAPPAGLGAVAIALVGWSVLLGAALFATEREPAGGGPEWKREGSGTDRGGPVSRGRTLLVLYVALTVALILPTPWPGQFWRYLAPLAPISALFLVEAARAAVRPLARWRGLPARIAGAAPLSLLLVWQLMGAREFLRARLPVSWYDAQGVERPFPLLTYGSEWHTLDRALEWLRQRAGPLDIFATSVPHLAYLRTGRRAVLPPMEQDPEVARRLLDEVPVRFVLLDGLGTPDISERYARPAVEHRPEWRKVYEAQGAQIYERIR